jgi:hypothetical protein
MANRKRTSLDALISPAGSAAKSPSQTSSSKKAKAAKVDGKAAVRGEREAVEGKSEVVRQTLYLPLPVFDQLQELFFEEQRGRVKRRRMHDYFLEGIDLLFKDRGLRSIKELTGKK